MMLLASVFLFSISFSSGNSKEFPSASMALRGGECFGGAPRGAEIGWGNQVMGYP